MTPSPTSCSSTFVGQLPSIDMIIKCLKKFILWHHPLQAAPTFWASCRTLIWFNFKTLKKVHLETQSPDKQCCGSGMFIPDPDFYPSRIPDPKTGKKKREGWKNICCHTFFCSHKFHNIVNYFIFEMLKKKIRANFQRIIELLSIKMTLSSQKKWVWDSGSEIREPEKT